MRRTLTIIASAIAFIACGSNAASNAKDADNQANKDNVEATSESKGPVDVKADGFRKYIYDFKASPDKFVFKGSRPAVIDFHASWCPPCRVFAPVYKEVALEYSSKVDFYKVDVDASPEIAALFGVQSIPTVVYITEDGKWESTLGSMGKKDFVQNIESTFFKK